MPVNLAFEEEGNTEPNKKVQINYSNKDSESETHRCNVEESNISDAIDKRRIVRGAVLIEEQCYLRNTSFHKLIGLVLVFVLSWVAIFVVIGDAFLPRSDLFKLVLLVLCSYLSGVFATIIGLPHTVGMLLVGSLLRTMGFISLSPEYEFISITLRLLAISVTITRSGLGLSFHSVYKYKWTILKYSFGPSTIEAIIFANLIKFIFELSWIWAFALGFIITATSSAPSMNILSHLKDTNLYVNDKMKIVLENSAYIDNIYSISAFTVLLTTISSFTDETFVQICNGLLDLFVGSVIGITLGSITACFPHKRDEYMLQKRCLLVTLNGTCTYFGCKVIGFPSGGALACFVAASISSYYWSFQGWAKYCNPVFTFQCKLWSLMMEPLLFGVVGYEIDLKLINVTELAVIIGLFGLLILVIYGLLILYGEKYENKEKLFIILSWMPKGTVQIALGPQIFDMLRKKGASKEEDYSTALMFLRVAVLSVITITTLFSILIKCSSKYLLLTKRNNNSEMA